MLVALYALWKVVCYKIVGMVFWSELKLFGRVFINMIFENLEYKYKIETTLKKTKTT